MVDFLLMYPPSTAVMTISSSAQPSRDNKPWQGKHSLLSLLCLLPPLPSEQTALPLEATWQGQGHSGLLTGSLSAVVSPRWEHSFARMTHGWYFHFPAVQVMYTFPLFSFTNRPERPAAVKCKHSPREASAHFSLYNQPPPPTNPVQTPAYLLHLI